MDSLDLRVVDHWDDEGLLLRKTFGANVPPVFATAANLSEASQRHPKDYAVFVKTAAGLATKFPLVDAGNAAASAVYFAECGQYLPLGMQKEAAVKITQALEGFGMPTHKQLDKLAAVDLGSSEGADDAALMSLFASDSDDQFELLRDEFDGLSPRGRRQLAMQVKTAGINLDDIPELKDYVSNQVGLNLGLAIEARKMATGWEPNAASALDLIKEKTASGQLPADEAVEALELFDRRMGITQYYERSVPDPVYSIYGGQAEEDYTKVASIQVGDKMYDNEDVISFAQGAGTRLEGEFGAQFAQQFAADPVAVLESLPETHKAIVAGMMDDA